MVAYTARSIIISYRYRYLLRSPGRGPPSPATLYAYRSIYIYIYIPTNRRVAFRPVSRGIVGIVRYSTFLPVFYPLV